MRFNVPTLSRKRGQKSKAHMFASFSFSSYILLLMNSPTIDITYLIISIIPFVFQIIYKSEHFILELVYGPPIEMLTKNYGK